jgi:putative endonuclease
MCMYYVYVIKSISHNTRYVGSAKDISKRINEHNAGRCRYTSGRMPWQLLYQEEYSTRSDAMKREKFLKSGKGREFLDARLGEI